MIRSFGDLCKCLETSSSTLLVWRLAACESRQADGTQTCDNASSASRAPNGRVGSARQNGAAETLLVGGAWRRETNVPGSGGARRLAAVRVTARR